MQFTIKIIPNDRNTPAGKLADAELIFGADAGPLAGLRLVGFSVWTRRNGGMNITVPARTFSVNGERRSFALIRTYGETDPNASAGMRELREAIIGAYTEYAALGAPYTPEDRVSA